MDHTPFAYGGLHFVPEQQFESQGQYHRRIPLSRMGQEAEVDLFPGKFAYSHASFYTASTDKNCDIFRCVESGCLYVPCEDGLRPYVPNSERGREHDER